MMLVVREHCGAIVIRATEANGFNGHGVPTGKKAAFVLGFSEARWLENCLRKVTEAKGEFLGVRNQPWSTLEVSEEDGQAFLSERAAWGMQTVSLESHAVKWLTDAIREAITDPMTDETWTLTEGDIS